MLHIMAALVLTTLASATHGSGPDVQLTLSPTLPAADRPFVLKTAAIVARQIQQRCNATVEQPPPSAATERQSTAPIVIELAIDASLGQEAYAIRDGATVTISGGDARGVLFGAGKFLRSSRFDGPRSAPFTPSPFRGTGAPGLPGSFRGSYFAIHYDNCESSNRALQPTCLVFGSCL